MTFLRVIGTFLAMSVLATAATLTAAFLVWNLLDLRPGTAGALGTLFLLAPAAGLVTGILAAARAARPAPPANPRLAFVLNGALGGLAGYGIAMVALDLTAQASHVSPPPEAWRAFAPAAAGLLLGALLGFRALRRH